MRTDGIHALNGLLPEEFALVRELQLMCNAHDGVNVKFNYDMMRRRDPGMNCDYCYYMSGKLAGYLALDRFGTKAELTSAVHPDFRRQGIFKRLYFAAISEAAIGPVDSLLLVGYRGSGAGSAAIASLGVSLKESEYCLRATIDELVQPKAGTMDLEPVSITNEDQIETLSNLLQISFPNATWGSPSDIRKELSQEGYYYWFALKNGQRIGQIGAISTGDSGYIRGVGVLPELRGRGYGRRMLFSVLQKLIVLGNRHFELDVATENESALSVYTSCGFVVKTVYDYYDATALIKSNH